MENDKLQIATPLTGLAIPKGHDTACQVKFKFLDPFFLRLAKKIRLIFEFMLEADKNHLCLDAFALILTAV